MKARLFMAVILLAFAIAFLGIPDQPGQAYPPPGQTPTNWRGPTPTYPPAPGDDDVAPVFAYWDCYAYARVDMMWYDPPSGIGAMSYAHPGLLYVSAISGSFTRPLIYDGYSIDLDGKLIHLWHTFYTLPPVPFSLNFYVNSIAGGSFWAEETFWPDCFSSPVAYLPLVRK